MRPERVRAVQATNGGGGAAAPLLHHPAPRAIPPSPPADGICGPDGCTDGVSSPTPFIAIALTSIIGALSLGGLTLYLILRYAGV